MFNIVQISKSDYDALKEKAELNQSQINKRVDEAIKQQKTLDLRVSFSCEKDSHWNYKTLEGYVSLNRSSSEFRALSFSEIYELSEKAQKAISQAIEKRYGKYDIDKKEYQKKLRDLNFQRLKFIGITLIGWILALAVCLLVVIF